MPPQNTTDTFGQENSAQTNSKLEMIKMEALEITNPKIERTVVETTATAVVPPDGGWGWVVMAASFMCNIVVDGIVFSSGMFQDKIREEFSVSKGYVALVSSLLSGFYLMAGPFVSILANQYGFRTVTMIGTFTATFGFGISYYATSVEFLFFSYGILGGVGFCLIYIPSVITIGYYFEKWRALATGIALCGSGIGTFIMAPISNFLIELAGWRGALVIQATIILFCLIFALAYRPIKPVQIAIVKENIKNENGIKFKVQLPKSDKQLPEGRLAYSMPNSTHNTYIGAPVNNNHPTALEVFRGSAANLDKNSLIVSSKNDIQGIPKTKVISNSDMMNIPKELSTVGENEEESENYKLVKSELKPVIISGRRNTISEKYQNSIVQNEIQDPPAVYRDDMFFTGSLIRLPQYTSQSSLAYHVSVTKLPNKPEFTMNRRQEKQSPCLARVKGIFLNILDLTLLKSPSFLILATSGFLTMMGFFIPFIFVTPRAIAEGMDESLALFIVSAIGISNTFARIGCGLLSSFKGTNALTLNNIAITAGGLATIFSGYIVTDVTQFLFAAIFGICAACFSALRSIIAVELMGLEKLTNTFGFLMLFQGIAAAIGAPIAGIFFDLTGSYDASFWLAGSLITISAIICYPLNYINRWEKKKAECRKIEATA